MRRALVLLACLGLAGIAASCAKSQIEEEAEDGGLVGPDGSTMAGDASGCPQYDLMSDPKHCGSCTKACTTDQVCSMGMCKAMCDPPTTKCAADAGVSCVDLAKDPKHCGNCATACEVGDGGGLTPGHSNPDASVFIDGGYDGGPGWVLGAPSCDKSMCGVTCPMGFTACEDKVCYDTKNHHDRCGDCSTQCAQSEWCLEGKCCATDQLVCNGACTSVLSDANNCGACGNKCPMNAPNCISGMCSNAYTYSENFVNKQTPTTACTNWKTFAAGLGSNYSSMRISGSQDMVGLTCNDPMVTKNMAMALKNKTSYTAMCNGHTWSNCNRYDNELWIDPPAQCSGNNCPSPGYIIRPCINNENWGGVKTATCTNNPTQVMTLSFQ